MRRCLLTGLVVVISAWAVMARAENAPGWDGVTGVAGVTTASGLVLPTAAVAPDLAPPPPVAPPAAPAADQGAQPAGDGAGDGASADPKPWTLPQPCLLEKAGIHVSGWLQQGLTFNPQCPGDDTNGPVATNDRANDYELNQFWLTAERVTKTDGDGFDIGGRIDACYGTDWRYGDCLGLENRINAPNDLYGLVLPQFYFEVAYNDLTVKLGHYAVCLGYEIVPAPANFFYSHSYALTSEPILTTGVQADYKLSKNWSINAGFNRGWNTFEDDNDKFDFLGGVKWHNDDNTTSVSYEIDVGPQDPAGVDSRYVYALVVKQQLTKKLLYVAQHNMGGSEGANPRTGGYAMCYGLDQYLIYTINSKWSAGMRAEWFRDDGGGYVSGVGNLNNGWTGAPGFDGSFSELTMGLNWRPHPNLVVRPEIRWDWYTGTTNVAGQLPFDDGLRSDQFLFAVDAVFTF